ncbi:unnamed protein product, partial [Staurois parvus]
DRHRAPRAGRVRGTGICPQAERRARVPREQAGRQASCPTGAERAGVGHRTPKWSDRSRALKAERRGAGPQARGATGLGPSGGSDRSRAPRSGAAGAGSPRRERRAGAGPPSGVVAIQGLSGPQAERRGTESPGTTVGLRVNWYDRRHWVRHCMVWRWTAASGHQASGHLGSTAGTASGSGNGSVGSRVNWYDRGHWVRHWIV